MATGYTKGDPSKLDRAGGAMTGPLTLSDGSPAASEDYVATHGGGGGGAVASVNGKTGVVVLSATDVGADASGAASSAVAGHVGAADPHGDRAYADGKLATKADLVGGVIPTAQLPALAINDVFVVASQAAMLGLTAQRGDIAIRTDIHESFVLAADAPSVLANWVKLDHPADAVLVVNGQTGTVILGAADVGAVPTGRQIATDATLTGGGDLSADRTFGVVANSSTQRVEVAKGGALVAARKRLNLIEGTNVTLTVADNPGADRVDVTVNATGGGGGAGIKTVGTGFVTSGDITVPAGSFVQIGPDLSIAAVAGDRLVLSPDLLVRDTGGDLQFEAATRVGSADNRYWSSGTPTSLFPGGLGAWYVPTGFHSPRAARYTVQADDIVTGMVTVRFYARMPSASRVVQASALYPLRWDLDNLGSGS